VGGGGALPGQQPEWDGLPAVHGGGVADRVGVGGERVQDGGGAAAEAGGGGLGRERDRRGLPSPLLVQERARPVGRLLEAQHQLMNIRSTDSSGAYPGRKLDQLAYEGLVP